MCSGGQPRRHGSLWTALALELKCKRDERPSFWTLKQQGHRAMHVVLSCCESSDSFGFWRRGNIVRWRSSWSELTWRVSTRWILEKKKEHEINKNTGNQWLELHSIVDHMRAKTSLQRLEPEKWPFMIFVFPRILDHLHAQLQLLHLALVQLNQSIKIVNYRNLGECYSGILPFLRNVNEGHATDFCWKYTGWCWKDESTKFRPLVIAGYWEYSQICTRPERAAASTEIALSTKWTLHLQGSSIVFYLTKALGRRKVRSAVAPPSARSPRTNKSKGSLIVARCWLWSPWWMQSCKAHGCRTHRGLIKQPCSIRQLNMGYN